MLNVKSEYGLISVSVHTETSVSLFSPTQTEYKSAGETLSLSSYEFSINKKKLKEFPSNICVFTPAEDAG